MVSNLKKYSGKSLNEIRENASFGFEPSRGWADKLGSKKLDLFAKEIKNSSNKVAIFGAGGEKESCGKPVSRRKAKVADRWRKS